MLMAVICSSLVGAVLGTRFKFFVLFPAVPLAFLVTAGAVGLAQEAAEPALLAGVAAGAALQIGYMAGLLTRLAIAGARLSPKNSLRSTTAAQG